MTKEQREALLKTGPVHLISATNGKETLARNFVYGDGALEEMYVFADQEIEIKIEWNFSNGDFAPDWGLTVYGDDGSGSSIVKDSLILTHSKGL